MINNIQYWAILGDSATEDRPAGLVRRLEHHDGPDDEVLNRDMSWTFTPMIIESERGNGEEELVEVSHEQASRIVEYLREKYASERGS